MMIDIGNLPLPSESFNKLSCDDTRKIQLLLAKVSGMRFLDVCSILNKNPKVDWCDYAKRNDLNVAIENEFKVTIAPKDSEEPMTFFNIACTIIEARKYSK